MMSTSGLGVSNGSRVVMAATKRRTVTRKVTKKSSAKPGDRLWLPNAERPAWLDGSMPGDRGFDPLGLSRPVEYLQVDVDENDQNAAVNKKGSILGKFQVTTDKVSTETLQPYSEVFGIQRFRECELIHGRWCMLATAGCIIQELTTGIPWQNAGQAILESGGNYLGFELPFSLNTLVWIEVLLVGGAELYRNGELDTTKRCYPGGYFDPLGFAGPDQDPVKVQRLKEAEIKHCRLAMVAFFGFSAQVLYTGKGVFDSLGVAVDL